MYLLPNYINQSIAYILELCRIFQHIFTAWRDCGTLCFFPGLHPPPFQYIDPTFLLFLQVWGPLPFWQQGTPYSIGSVCLYLVPSPLCLTTGCLYVQLNSTQHLTTPSMPQHPCVRPHSQQQAKKPACYQADQPLSADPTPEHPSPTLSRPRKQNPQPAQSETIPEQSPTKQAVNAAVLNIILGKLQDLKKKMDGIEATHPILCISTSSYRPWPWTMTVISRPNRI